MVAITVAIAATVYIWVGGFGVGGDGDDGASATVQPHTGNTTSDWIRITLTSGDNAPYDESDVSVEILDSDNSVESTVCDTPEQEGAYPGCADPFENGDTWDVGSSKFVPCAGDGGHQVTLTILGTAVLDREVNCQNAA